jgi:hypothetical protein
LRVITLTLGAWAFGEPWCLPWAAADVANIVIAATSANRNIVVRSGRTVSVERIMKLPSLQSDCVEQRFHAKRISAEVNYLRPSY